MRRYGIVGSQTVPGTLAGIGGEAECGIVALESAATVVPHLYGITCGCTGTPADQSHGFSLGRFTVRGSWSGVTPYSLDGVETAGNIIPSISAGYSNQTGAATYTAGKLMTFAINQRATFTWLEDPDRGIILPATANAGVGLYFSETTGGSVDYSATFLFAE